MLLTAAAVKMESEGPVIFRQERLGLDGNVFEMYKFRSMYTGTEKQGSGQYSFAGDPRVTGVGRFIRKTSIDELPQFINILKGEMSVIGPRPVLTWHPYPYEGYSAEQKKRFSVRPGVTGWAQVNGRKGLPWGKRIELDLEYVENISLCFDLKIFFLTVIKIITAEDNVNIGKTVDKDD